MSGDEPAEADDFRLVDEYLRAFAVPDASYRPHAPTALYPDGYAEPDPRIINIETRKPRPPAPDPLANEIVDASAVIYDADRDQIAWVVEGLIPVGSVCLFSGGKGLGKSRLLMDLLTAAALGQPWLGHDVARMSGFGMFCEDPDRTVGLGQQVLEGRLARSLAARGAGLADLENRVHWRSGQGGRLSYIWDSNRNTGAARPTELWQRLEKRLEEYGSQILVLDTRSHTFNGSINDNYATTVFLNWLSGWAARHQGCVILTCHPPKDKSARWAGCEEWSAVPRSHLHLERPKHYDPEAGEGRNERVLVREKGNENDEIPLEIPITWSREHDLFVLDADAAKPPTEHSFFGRMEFDMQVLRAVGSLIDDGAQVQAFKAAKWSLVKLVHSLPGFQRASEFAILGAQDRLVARGDLVRVTIGDKVLVRPRNRPYGGEADA